MTGKSHVNTLLSSLGAWPMVSAQGRSVTVSDAVVSQLP